MADVNKYAATPSFSDYGPSYGGKVPSIANLAGKKIMIIPGVSALAACEEIAQAASNYRQGRGHGADDLRQPGHHGRAQHRDRERDPPGIRGDHHGLRDGPVDERAGDRPGRRRPASWWAPTAAPRTWTSGAGTTYNTDDPYALDAKLAAEQAVAQHNGQPFNAIAITSTATGPATVIEEASIQSTSSAQDCPKCTLTAVNVEVPNWQTQVASTVTSQLLQHPDVSVLFPDYAGELTYVLAGIQAAHRTGVKTYLAFGGGTPFVQLQTAQPGQGHHPERRQRVPAVDGLPAGPADRPRPGEAAPDLLRRRHRPGPDHHPG